MKLSKFLNSQGLFSMLILVGLLLSNSLVFAGSNNTVGPVKMVYGQNLTLGNIKVEFSLLSGLTANHSANFQIYEGGNYLVSYLVAPNSARTFTTYLNTTPTKYPIYQVWAINVSAVSQTNTLIHNYSYNYSNFWAIVKLSKLGTDPNTTGANGPLSNLTLTTNTPSVEAGKSIFLFANWTGGNTTSYRIDFYQGNTSSSCFSRIYNQSTQDAYNFGTYNVTYNYYYTGQKFGPFAVYSSAYYCVAIRLSTGKIIHSQALYIPYTPTTTTLPSTSSIQPTTTVKQSASNSSGLGGFIHEVVTFFKNLFSGL